MIVSRGVQNHPYKTIHTPMIDAMMLERENSLAYQCSDIKVGSPWVTIIKKYRQWVANTRKYNNSRVVPARVCRKNSWSWLVCKRLSAVVVYTSPLMLNSAVSHIVSETNCMPPPPVPPGKRGGFPPPAPHFFLGSDYVMQLKVPFTWKQLGVHFIDAHQE